MFQEGDFIISQDRLTSELCLSRISFLEEGQDIVLSTTFALSDESNKYFIEIPESIEVNTSHGVKIPSQDIGYVEMSKEFRYLIRYIEIMTCTLLKQLVSMCRLKHTLEFYWKKYSGMYLILFFKIVHTAKLSTVY